jgi:DNA polymerase-1
MHLEGLDDALYVAVHDELVVDADAADAVERIMTTPPPDLERVIGRRPVLRTGRAELGTTWRPKK